LNFFFRNRQTDLCDYCEKGKELKVELEKKISKENFVTGRTIAFGEAKEYFTRHTFRLSSLSDETYDLEEKKVIDIQIAESKKFVADFEDYESIIFHQNVAKCQRLAYNDHHTNVETLRGKIMIEVDFKEKIKIGLSPRQISKEFYNLQQRSCLGI
jgi:hypothetical protein